MTPRVWRTDLQGLLLIQAPDSQRLLRGARDAPGLLGVKVKAHDGLCVAGDSAAHLPLGDIPQGHRSVLIAGQEARAGAGVSLRGTEQRSAPKGSWCVLGTRDSRNGLSLLLPWGRPSRGAVSHGLHTAVTVQRLHPHLHPSPEG